MERKSVCGHDFKSEASASQTNKDMPQQIICVSRTAISCRNCRGAIVTRRGKLALKNRTDSEWFPLEWCGGHLISGRKSRPCLSWWTLSTPIRRQHAGTVTFVSVSSILSNLFFFFFPQHTSPSPFAVSSASRLSALVRVAYTLARAPGPSRAPGLPSVRLSASDSPPHSY